MPIKALDRRVDDVALYRFGVRDHERGDRPHRSLHRVENIGRRVREAEIGLDRRGLGAERFELVAQSGDISRIAAPGHALVVLAPECGRHVPSLAGESQGDRSGDALPPTGARDQRDSGRSAFVAQELFPFTGDARATRARR